MNIFNSIWQYLSINQTRSIRIVHLLVLILVITQIIISSGMKVNSAGIIPADGYTFYFTWMHIFIGISLLLLSTILIVICLTKRGLRHFYPYLWNDFSQIKQDMKELAARHLPDSSPRGIAASVQGLGLGALLLAVISGSSWFILWSQGSALAHDVENIHKMLVGLIEIYVVAHGAMGILHYLLWRKKKNQ